MATAEVPSTSSSSKYSYCAIKGKHVPCRILNLNSLLGMRGLFYCKLFCFFLVIDTVICF